VAEERKESVVEFAKRKIGGSDSAGVDGIDEQMWKVFSAMALHD